jgi:hypothetical protein
MFLLQKYATEITIVSTVIFIFLHFFHPVVFATFMNTLLGKLLSCVYIIFYSTIDKIYGLLVCLLFIVYYQMDSVRWIREGFSAPPPIIPSSGNNDGKAAVLPFITTAQMDFKKKHCSINGELIYKDLVVKRDMTPIVFPEIHFANDKNICNVCDDNCEYKLE